MARMGGTVPAPLSPEIRPGGRKVKRLGDWAIPLQAASKLSAAAAYIDEIVWKAQDAQVVERLEGISGVGRPPL